MATVTKYQPSDSFATEGPTFNQKQAARFNKGAAVGGAVSGGTTGAKIGSAVGMPWLGAAVGAIGGGIYSGFKAGGKKEDPQMAAARNMMEVYRGYTPMDAENRQYDVYDYQLAGELNPELEQAIRQQESELAGIQEDPTARNAQLEALSMIKDRAYGVITPEEMEAYNQAAIQQEVQSASDMQAALQSRARRGKLSQTDVMAAEAAQAQQAADMAGQRGMDNATLRNQARMQGMANLSNMSQSMYGQDYGMQSNKAKAQDLINQFNTQQRLGAQQRNVGSKNQAQAFNLSNKQSIADMNAQRQEERNQNVMQSGLDAKRAKLDRDLNLAGKPLLNRDNGMGYSNYQDERAANQTAGAIGLVGDVAGAFTKPRNPNDVGTGKTTTVNDNNKWGGIA